MPCPYSNDSQYSRYYCRYLLNIKYGMNWRDKKKMKKNHTIHMCVCDDSHKSFTCESCAHRHMWETEYVLNLYYEMVSGACGVSMNCWKRWIKRFRKCFLQYYTRLYRAEQCILHFNFSYWIAPLNECTISVCKRWVNLISFDQIQYVIQFFFFLFL